MTTFAATIPSIPRNQYECRTREMGAAVYGVCATPGAQPTDEHCGGPRAGAKPCLYLPDNLRIGLTYIPLGMEEAVENPRNRARKGKKRLPQKS